ncbi:fumarylacetoacetate hydrolase family protein [Thermoplasma sp.]|uniref:fumarylacetoacetate hydrolase family protein n=1 Tax=Thermoplasma sp. TaxID=1973142 RepID=UPI0012797477|nr:fumarylacetoacetate hydrolase family protein [Thermoplasma sp.]KAA8922269.1 MAG: fumarylacetoacetate hydrolase family protein [Thermoplasma sp.]
MKVGRCKVDGTERLFTVDGNEIRLIDGISNINEFIASYGKDISSRGYDGEIVYLPAVNPGKIFLPAVNFRSHSEESETKFPPKPYFFTKFSNALVAHNGAVHRPKEIEKLDYEGEIGIVIGKRGKRISVEEAEDHIFGFTIVDDVSARDHQFPEMHPYGYNWVQGKAFDDALPVGPYIVTRDEVKFPLKIETRVNGELRQSGTTDDMVFSVAQLISTVSQTITLEPGDLITTGTPAGVAAFTAARYLSDGDTVSISVSGIGELSHRIEDEKN